MESGKSGSTMLERFRESGTNMREKGEESVEEEKMT